MPGEKQDRAEEQKFADINTVNVLLRSLGQIVNSSRLYGSTHKVVVQSMDAAFMRLATMLAGVDSLNISVVEEELLADGRPTDMGNPLVASFGKQLLALGASGFTLSPGITREEFTKLLELLTITPEKLKEMGQFAQAVQNSALKHVTAKVAQYQLVTEEEEVIKKGEEGGGAKDSALLLKQVVSFLKGADVEDKPGVIHEIANMIVDADKLSEVIVEAAKEQMQAEGLEGQQNLVKKTIESVRRFYDSVLEDPSSQTQSGKKQLLKTLSLLEEKLEQKLHELGGIEEDPSDTVFEEAIEEMSTALEIDSLAAEYAKKYKLIEKAQKRILKFIKATVTQNPIASMDLKDRLLEAGLNDEDWMELLARSMGQGQTGDQAPAVSPTLQELLSKLDPVQAPDGQKVELSPQQLDTVIARIKHELTLLASNAEQRIEEFGAKMRESVEKPEEAERILSHHALMVMLAELGQEICQPLSVITASIDMIGGGRLGPISQPQTEMLTLAHEGTERIQKLADKLIEIAGVPESRSPDAEVLGEIYHQDGAG